MDTFKDLFVTRYARKREGSVPLDGMERDGMPTGQALARLERQGHLSVFPRKSAWPELDQMDQEIAELSGRHTAAADRLRGLSERRANAPMEDADALARWEIAGRAAERPASVVDALEVEIGEARRETEGLQAAIQQLLERKAAFVEGNRERLATVARQQADEALERMLSAITVVEAERTALVQLREAEVWAGTFPDQSASERDAWDRIAGGREVYMERAGLQVQVPAQRIFELLRDDARFVRKMATPRQRAVIAGQDPAVRPSGALWDDSDEGLSRRQQAMREAAMREAAEMQAMAQRERARLGIET